MQLVIKSAFLLECLCFALLFSIFSLDYFLLFRIVLLEHTFIFFLMKRNIVPVICPSERRETINVISVQLTIELGDLCYTFGSRVETDAISKVLNLKFWNLFLSKTIKHLICPHSFMQFFFSLFSSNKLDILFYSDIHHLHVNPLQSVPKQFCAMNMNAL